MTKIPEIARNWALFLDLDGTLLDIAPKPTAVIIPEGLIGTLQQVRANLDGALAVVSGRPLSDIDTLLKPAVFPGAGEHGAVIRYASGKIDAIAQDRRPPASWISELRQRTKPWTGVLVEEKTYAVAIHFRLAPERKDDIYALARELVQRAPKQFELADAKAAVELRPHGVTKGHAVTQLMTSAPFQGRIPVFVGDDVTDEDGMAAATALGGHGFHVHEHFGGDTSAVRAWLETAAHVLRRELSGHGQS